MIIIVIVIINTVVVIPIKTLCFSLLSMNGEQHLHHIRSHQSAESDDEHCDCDDHNDN